MKIDPVSVTPHPLAAAISPGIYPYLGGSVDPGLLRSVVSACGGAVVSGRQGAKLAAQTPGVLVDPAAYGVAGHRRFRPALRLRRMADAPASRGCPAHPHRHAADPERRPVRAPQSAGALGIDRRPHPGGPAHRALVAPGGAPAPHRGGPGRRAARGDRLAAPVQRPRYRPGRSGPADVHRRGRAAAGGPAAL